MENRKKRWIVLLFALSLALMPLGQREASAADCRVKKGTISVEFSKAKNRKVRLFLYGGSVLSKQKGCIRAVSFEDLVKKQVYTLKISTETEGEGYGPWTVKYFVPTSFTAKRYKNELRVTTQAVENVRAYRLLVSKEKEQGFLKAARILPGESARLTELNGEGFTVGMKIYLRLVPVLTNGKKAVALTKTFTWKG